MVAVINSSRKRGQQSETDVPLIKLIHYFPPPTKYLYIICGSIYYEILSWVLYWVRTGHG